MKALPNVPYRAVLRLERRASHEGMVSVGGNLYSVPDTTRRRVFDVHVLADEIRLGLRHVERRAVAERPTIGGGDVRPGMIDQDTAHQARGNGKEVGEISARRQGLRL